MNFNRNKTNKILLVGFLFALSMVMGRPDFVYSQDGDLKDIEMITGDIQSIKVKNLSRISITEPDVADISDAKPDEVIVMAKRPGQTVLFLWDESGKRSIIIRVVAEDMALVKTRIQELLRKAAIAGVSLEENTYEGRVVVTGELELEQKEKLEEILIAFDDKIINLVKEKIYLDQIQIDMQITELNESVTKNLGFDWGYGTDGTRTNDFTLIYQENKPQTDGSIGDLFKIGDFNRANSILTTVNALVTEGKGKILSKPRLVVVSGKEASFLVGGEIPFKTTTLNTTGGTVTEETTFKQYGVNMTITPTLRNGKIEIDLNVEVSDVDASNRSGDDVAFLTRTATTHLNLEDRQTIILAGLIKKSNSSQVKRLPFVSKIPVLGLLFRSVSTPVPDQDTELVISLTPTILKSAASQKVKTASITQTSVKETIIKEPQASQGNFSMSAGYARELQNKIASAINYPYEARENGWEGTVKLSLHILKDGTLASVSLKQSSGYDIFDQDAINTAKIVAPYPMFSSDMNNEDVVVVVPIVYSQNNLSKEL